MKMSFILNYQGTYGLLIVIIGAFILFILYYYFSLSKQIVYLLGLFAVSMFRILPSVNRVLYALNSIKYYFSTTDIIYKEIKV